MRPTLPVSLAFAALSLWVSACASNIQRGTASVAGGSVLDFDRGSAVVSDVETGVPSGAASPIVPPLPPPAVESAPQAKAPSAPPASRPLVAGPMQQLQAQPAQEVRAVQVALSERGYYHNPPSGQSDPALVEALRLFQADHGLPMTGRLDAGTASLLGLKPPASPLPPRGG